MQTDVSASVPLTSSGQFAAQNSAGNVQSCRVKAIYIVPTGTAGTVVLTDGGASGPTRLTVNTVASATQPTYLLMPGEGVLFRTNVYGALTSVGSATIFYG
jgi:hypothetical protein